MSEQLTKESFKTKIFDWEKNKEWKYEGEVPAIIDFYAEWCGPCKMVGPVLEELAVKHAGKLAVYKVNTDEQPELSAMFDIQSVPTLFFVPKEGEPRFALGALPKKDLERAIVEVLKVE
ncbi:MAG: thioredoxin [Spirochaetaceae bacterium]|nr:thioredoxin [Spirochaetaceae bacterium]